MSQAQLLEIEKTLLETLSIEELEDFILKLSSKTFQKKQQQNKLPQHIREGIKESLEDYKKGNYVTLEPGEEMTMQNIRNKFKIKSAN